jgi:hypothetical protein
MSMTRRVLVAALVALPSLAVAQKKALTQADWDIWKSISGSMITSDGKWAAYTVAPLVGDGEFIIRSTSGNTEYKVPRGYLGRPNNVPGGLRPRAGGNPEDEPSGPQIAAGQFTADGKFALVQTYPTQAEFDRVARDRRASAAVQARSDLAIVRLSDGNVTTLPRVRSFRLPRLSGAWMTYVSADSAPAAPGQQGGAAPGARPTGPRRTFGTTITLRNMATGAEEKLADIREYAFDDSAKVLVYSIVGRAGDKDGVYSRNLATGAVATLTAGKGDYDQLVLDRTGTQVAFVSNRDEFGKDGAQFSIFHGTLKGGAATAVLTSKVVGAGLHIVESANVGFTRNGNAITFNVAAPFPDTVPADSLVGKAVFDLWHYNDRVLQPTQKLNAARDRTASLQAIYHIATKKFVRLASDSIPNVQLSDDGRLALANSREKYMVQAMWGDGLSDVYLIDATTGTPKLVREGFDGNWQLSTGAKYLAYFEKDAWHTYNIATGKTTNVTGSVKGVSFTNETNDTPGEANPAWGIAGWTRDDRSMLVYDRWDIWEVDPTGVRAPVNVTDGWGRKNTTQLRMAGGGGGFGGGGGGGGAAAGGDDQRGIDPSKPLQLRGVNNETKAQVFASDVLGAAKEPTITLTANAAYGNLTKAADAEQYIVTKGTFTEFPDLYTGPSVTSLRKISDANPQQKDYRWGTVDLVRWVSADGVPLKGLLYKPEGFDSTKKYPMIVYHYEQLSQGLHSYIAPNGRNVTNPTHYISNGYLVFEPDINYIEGYPGPSALKSIVPGVTSLMQRGFVDPKGIAIQGQSWGGYQGLYMITQTNIFSAAMLGAPVVNMTSAYGGIRWGSGINRSVQYEEGQSRIGGSLWEYPQRYIENSPLFWMDKVQTPLFIMSNDMDDAVPWYQGIETFVAMRRLGKEVYFINYNNDVHNPASRANQKDMAMRMQQFFDHKLRGAPAPDWMKNGIPYLSKGKDQLGTPAAATPAIP